MKVKKNCIEKVQDWADDKLRQMCGRITPGKRLTVILLMFVFFDSINPLNYPNDGRSTEE